jgi:hypothetical protein
MVALRARKALTVWIACLALLLGSLVPTLARALHSDAPGRWADICTTAASPMAGGAAQQRLAGPMASIEHLHEHCPQCSPHLAAPGLPPPRLDQPALLQLRFSLPRLFLVAPRPLFAWAKAQPRAPPRLT